MPSPPVLTRRRFLEATAATAILGTASFPALAHVRERRLTLRHLHTGEKLRTTYFADGRYIEEELRAVDYVLRDWRTGEVKHIDPKLLDLLFFLRLKLETDAPYHVIGGYRSRKTNEMLRRMGRGAARKSLHIQGKAVDFRVPGRRLALVRKAAVSLRGGGVGYYPRSDFLHMDTGPVRYW